MFNVTSLDTVRAASSIVILFCEDFGRRCERIADGLWTVSCFGHVRNHDWGFESWEEGVLTDTEVHGLCRAACSPDDEVRIAF
jgi:hypothetical protein